MNQTKEFDAVAMKRRIQEQIWSETRDMTPEELLAYFHERIAQSRFANTLTPSNDVQQAHEDEQVK